MLIFILIVLLVSSSRSIIAFSFFKSLTFIIIKPPGIDIGSVNSFGEIFDIFFKIILENEFSFIHPIFPPFCEESETE